MMINSCAKKCRGVIFLMMNRDDDNRRVVYSRDDRDDGSRRDVLIIVNRRDVDSYDRDRVVDRLM